MGTQWKRIDMIGKKFGRLEVVEFAGIGKENRAMWKCRCDCGKFSTVSGKNLRNGNTKSCGCYSVEQATKRIVETNTTHGMTGSKLFKIWEGMKIRCKYDGVSRKHYKDKGITVCNEWMKFETFMEWAIKNGYEDGLSIDRIDNDGNYCPENCRWATYKQQQNNKTTNRIIEFNGERHTLSEWADIIGIGQDTLGKRLCSKTYSLERALTEPKNERGKYDRNKVGN